MKARSSSLSYSPKWKVRLPKLVPSFSSKGFPEYDDLETGKQASETAIVLDLFGPTLGIFLVSAFDIHHELVPRASTHFAGKELVFIDSGGYELADDYDSSEPRQYENRMKREFTEDDYRNVLDDLPDDEPFVIANFDHSSAGLDMSVQIERARNLFGSYPTFIHDFIVKPTGRNRYVNAEQVLDHLGTLQEFHVLGITEKQAGSSLLDRLVTIARIRKGLDSRGIDIPIHVWGGLDPVISPMYFCAGAELFDGVSWMRYGYYNDTSIPREAYTALTSGVQSQKHRSVYARLLGNLEYLDILELRMKQFVLGDCLSFAEFEMNAVAVETSYKALLARIRD